MEFLIELDKKVLLFLNSLHADWLDPIVLRMTDTWIWLPLYLFLVFIVIKTYKRDSWMAILAIAIVIVLTDQITSGLMKPYFARLRPSREPSLQGLVHLVNGYKGGNFSFASSHAANTFGTATFFFLMFWPAKRWIAWLFAWAAGMTYTRIYLGVHYPGDILVGGMIGVVCGWIGYKLFQLLHRKFQRTELAQ